MTHKILLSIILLLVATPVWADTHTASSCSYADVLTAYNAADAGDIVALPSGACSETWASTLTISKPITLQGEGTLSGGSYNTVQKITRNGTMIAIDNNTGSINANKIRITGIHFDRVVNQNDAYAITVDGGYHEDGEEITNLEIDNCRLDWGFKTLYFDDTVFGVVHSNYFYNINHGIYYDSSGKPVWADYSYAAGTGDMLFFEDNVFYYDATTEGTSSSDGIFYGINGGARIVVRYNDFDGSDCTKCFSIGPIHIYGFWGDDWRMTMLAEVYSNTADFTGESTHSNGNPKAQNFFGWRGGAMLLYDNTASADEYQNFAAVGTVCTDKVGGGSERDSQIDTYPMQDQVNNSFLWDNTWNGSAIDSGDVTNNSCTPTGDSDQRVGIQGDGNTHIEVWLQEPAASGGKNVFPGDLGGSNVDLDDMDGPSDDMYFTGTGANEYYGYTPYTYPHDSRSDTSCTGSLCGTTITGISIQ